ncbi:PrgI family protein [Candidatus Saccharibacteria bacterium]|nr:PrgI family protein [Candidatus Saccharibacteria bacterium]
MAQYKVPQDVEADDKLIGPFSFRQFVYLLIAGGLIALAVGLFQLFPVLAIIPVPFVFFFLALALPLKKDQPMETYLAALVSYYLKPRKRVWMPGQKESTILITAPKIAEDVRTRDISSEEATHRLSFLADIVDTEGYAIKGAGASPMREDLVAEANATPDMFETYQSQVLNRVIDQDKMSRHNTAVDEMRAAIEKNDAANAMALDEPTYHGGEKVILRADEKLENNDVLIKPEEAEVKPEEKPSPKPINNSIMELAHNDDFSVATIAKEANRINRKENGEVFVSLH